MPIVQMELLEGQTTQKKRELIKNITDTICQTINCPPEAVTIVIRDMPKTQYGVAGKLFGE